MVAPTDADGMQMPAGWGVPAEQRRQVLAHLDTDEERLGRDARDIRAWVNKQPHMPFLPESELDFIKTYLVNSKNSMEKAKKGLDTYFTARTVHYDFFGKFDLTEDDLNQYKKFMNIGLSKELTPDLTRVVIATITGAEQTEDDFRRMCRVNLLKADVGMRMDTSLGYELVVDLGSFTPGHAKHMVLGLNVLKTYMACTLGALPSRVRHLHLVNAPSFYATSYALLQNLFKEKLRKRLILHSSLKSLYTYVAPQYLPKELGGDLPSFQELESVFRACFTSPVANRFFALQRSLKVDESLRPGGPSQMHAEANFGCEGSFRKLALD